MALLEIQLSKTRIWVGLDIHGFVVAPICLKLTRAVVLQYNIYGPSILQTGLDIR